MDWELKLIAVWASIDIVVIATGWYVVNVIKPRFQNWWRRNIADYGPAPRLDKSRAVPTFPMASSLPHQRKLNPFNK